MSWNISSQPERLSVSNIVRHSFPRFTRYAAFWRRLLLHEFMPLSFSFMSLSGLVDSTGTTEICLYAKYPVANTGVCIGHRTKIHSWTRDARHTRLRHRRLARR